MIIMCPACSTRYLVDRIRFGDDGREVQCSHCGHEWWQPLIETMPASPLLAMVSAAGTLPPAPAESAPTNAGVPTAALESGRQTETERSLETGVSESFEVDDTLPREGEGELTFESEPDSGQSREGADPGDTGPELDDEADLDPDQDLPIEDQDPDADLVEDEDEDEDRTERRRRLFITAVAAVVALAVLGGVLVGARSSIVAAFPSMASFYGVFGTSGDDLGKGLEIRDVTSAVQWSEQADTLVVEGVIANIETEERPLPSIRVMLLDTENHEVHSVVVPRTQAILAPGQTIRFHTRIENPKEEARRIRVTFDGGGDAS
jgi:predicted Zn finger-like uncharacterized protein